MLGVCERRGCEIRTASDGTVVRVNGSLDQKTLDQMAAWVRGYVDSRCHDASPFPMPAIAQKMHGRETYQCGREKGHDGEHRWPDNPDAKWCWPDLAAQPAPSGAAAEDGA